MCSGLPWRGLVVLVFFIQPGSAGAQPKSDGTASRPLAAVPVTTPPVIDGDLSDEAWKSAGQAVTFFDREQGSVATDQTVAYIAYDAHYIYVAFDCHDSQPDRVEARETIRDSKYAGQQNGESPNKEDNVTFSIDPYFTKKADDVSVFSVNALGTPSAQIAGGRGGKLEWKGNWDSAAKKTSTGYAVEMRIPWQMLNYPSVSGPCTMGINFFRYQYRTKTETVWSNVTVHSFTDLEGLWQQVKVPSHAFRPKLSLLPYVLPGVKDGSFTFRSGVDARLAVSPEVTAVGSLNPDFNTIEGAVESIAFSRSERFVSEKRPFFLEGQDFFFPGTRFNDIGAYFYSRRVPTFDLGTKVYGKVSSSDSIGLLNSVTFGDRTDSVLRYKHDLSATSDVGFFVGQKAAAGDHNTVAMVDEHARFGSFGLETQFAKTWGETAGGGAVVLSANYQRGNNTSVFQYHTLSNDFQISDGFIPYFNYHGFFGFTDFSGQWRHGPWRGYDYGAYGIGWDHEDGSRYQRSVGYFGSVVSTSDVSYSFEHDYAIVDDTVDNTFQLGATVGSSNRFRKYGLNIQFGRLASQPATFLTPKASFRVFRHLDVSYSGAILNLQGTTTQNVLTMGYELSPTRSFGGRMVTLDSDTNWYLFYRAAGGKGTDFYVVLGDPNTRRFSRQLQVKLVFAF